MCGTLKPCFSSLLEAAKVKNNPICLFPFFSVPCTSLCFWKCTYPVSWTERVPSLSWPSPGCSWSGPIQTPGEQTEQEIASHEGDVKKKKKMKNFFARWLSGLIKGSLASSRPYNNIFRVTYFWQVFHFSPHISNFFILATVQRLSLFQLQISTYKIKLWNLGSVCEPLELKTSLITFTI